MKTRWIVSASLLFLTLSSLAGCSQSAPLVTEEALPTQAGTSGGLQAAGPAQAQGEAVPTPVTTENKAVEATRMPTPFSDETAQNASSARQDLARRLGMAVEEIKVAGIFGQEFSANAFYCRSPKERIAKDDSPAVISGFSILLNAAGRRYEYHASGQTVIFCRLLS